MKTTLQLEEVLQFFFGAFLFSQLDYSWWVFFALILTPDIGMLGYVVNTKVGAFTYNIFHHKGLALALFMVGVYFEIEYLEIAGIILFAHAAMDRIFGYGLKYSDSFKNTHLGKLGK